MAVHQQRLSGMEASPRSFGVALGAGLAGKFFAALELLATALLTAILAVMAARRRRITNDSLYGKRVLITGADSDLGKELVCQFVEQGCRVGRVVGLNSHVKVDVKEKDASGKSFMDSLETFSYDIRDPAQVAQLSLSVKKRLPQIDILVCLSAVTNHGLKCNSELDFIARLVNEELMTHFYLLQNLIPLIDEKGGHIVTIPAVTKHGTTYGSTREALVGVMATLTGQMIQSKTNITLTCARFHDTGNNKSSSDAASRLIEAIQKKQGYCDLSSSPFQHALRSAVQYFTKSSNGT